MLIVFEGIDGSGKTTCARKLTRELKLRGYNCSLIHTHSFSNDRSEKVISLFREIRRLKHNNELDALLYCATHYVDFIYRLTNYILPSLRKNNIVIMDRYIYTPFVRDSIRGINIDVVKKLYKILIKPPEPNIIIYLDVDPEIALKRVKRRKNKPAFYEAGQDIYLDMDIENSFIKYQTECRKQYLKVLPHKNLHVIDSSTETKNTCINIFEIIFPQLK